MSTEQNYPRDMVGYGSTLPDAQWPNRARIAVQFVMNYEEGGENCVLHGDAASEAFLSEIVGAQALKGVRHVNMESIYEYGSRAGFWRLMRMFAERRLPLTVFGVAMAMQRNPDAVASNSKRCPHFNRGLAGGGPRRRQQGSLGGQRGRGCGTRCRGGR